MITSKRGCVTGIVGVGRGWKRRGGGGGGGGNHPCQRSRSLFSKSGINVLQSLPVLLQMINLSSFFFKFPIFFFFQFCCAEGVFSIFTKNTVLSNSVSEDHLRCTVPQYVYLTCLLAFICVSVFLKLAASLKFIIMFIMGATHIITMEVTHERMFYLYDSRHKYVFLTFSQTTNFGLFQTERVCRHNFKLRKMAENSTKRVENTVGKGEIARYEQFLLFPPCFLKTCTADR